MLKEMGVSDFEDLLVGIPSKLLRPKMNLPAPLSEFEIQNLFKEIGAKNGTTKDCLSFLGGGSYEHFVPAAVAQIIGRQEFYTAYTPYQPEASQGTLQTIYEYQSLVSELMALDVTNASHYDGSTSLAEAVLLALRHTERNRILIAKSIHPYYREVVRTYLQGTPFVIDEVGFEANGAFSRAQLDQKLGEDVAGVVFQSPNFLGTIENLEGVAEKIHALGGLLIVAANPISLGVLKPPGEWGADIGVGEGQPLGIPLHFGGPYLGLFSTTRALMRKIPGRLSGLTRDLRGERAFCLTLQAREQHIRRERASSNICTNQALCALAACAYLTLLGKNGIREIGEINLDRASYLREKIAGLAGFRVNLETPIFNEFVVEAKKPFVEIEKKLLAQKIFAGIGLAPYYPELKNHFLVCATETKTQSQLDSFVEALKRC
jgi:glycine dehydrogenase subunit 1